MINGTKKTTKMPKTTKKGKKSRVWCRINCQTSLFDHWPFLLMLLARGVTNAVKSSSHKGDSPPGIPLRSILRHHLLKWGWSSASYARTLFGRDHVIKMLKTCLLKWLPFFGTFDPPRGIKPLHQNTWKISKTNQKQSQILESSTN